MRLVVPVLDTEIKTWNSEHMIQGWLISWSDACSGHIAWGWLSRRPHLTLRSLRSQGIPWDCNYVGRIRLKMPHALMESSVVCEINSGINCRARNIVYSIRYIEETCNDGETFRNIVERINEHLRQYDNKKQSSILYQHTKDQHEGAFDGIDFHIFSKLPQDPSFRQIQECSHRWNVPCTK